VVPELKRRGLFRTGIHGRKRVIILGLRRPENATLARLGAGRQTSLRMQRGRRARPRGAQEIDIGRRDGSLRVSASSGSIRLAGDYWLVFRFSS